MSEVVRQLRSTADGQSLSRPQHVRRVALLVNDRAGGGTSDVAAAHERFTSRFEAVERISIGSGGEHVARLAALRGTVDAIVVAGGDGTINRLLPALLDHPAPVGILPAGTANDLARTLGIPADPDRAAGIILEGRTRMIDVGLANGVPFVNAAGIGLSVAVSREMDRDVKASLGVLAYARAIWRVLRRNRGFHVALSGHGIGHHGRAVQVTVANGVHYGGGMTVHEDAAIDDGTLDVLVVRPRSPLEYLLNFFAFRRGRYGPRAPVRLGRTDRVRVVTRRARACALDGEVRTETPVEFAVTRAALEVFAPIESDAAG